MSGLVISAFTNSQVQLIKLSVDLFPTFFSVFTHEAINCIARQNTYAVCQTLPWVAWRSRHRRVL